MTDAFTYFFNTCTLLVNWLFSEALQITVSDYTASIGQILVAISVFSIVITAVLSYAHGQANHTGYFETFNTIKSMSHEVNQHRKH